MALVPCISSYQYKIQHRSKNSLLDDSAFPVDTQIVKQPETL